MANLNGPNVRVQVLIREGDYNDALYFTVDEYEKLTDQEVENAAKKRVADWVEFVRVESLKVTPVTQDQEVI